MRVKLDHAKMVALVTIGVSRLAITVGAGKAQRALTVRREVRVSDATGRLLDLIPHPIIDLSPHLKT